MPIKCHSAVARGPRARLIILTIFFATISACGPLPPQNPGAFEHHTVRTASDASKTITVIDGMVFYDSLARNKAIRFPPGTYVLEAEDDSYWYFRAPAPLEFRVFRSRRLTDGRDIPGGLMLGKSIVRLVPAGGYIDSERADKLLVRKLGGEFISLQGKYWTKSF